MGKGNMVPLLFAFLALPHLGQGSSKGLSKLITEEDKFHLLTEFLTPASCETCANDIEDVLHNCNFPIHQIDDFVSPECVGALVYAARDCSLCLCEVVAEQLPEEERPSLCPFCPDLPYAYLHQMPASLCDQINNPAI